MPLLGGYPEVLPPALRGVPSWAKDIKIGSRLINAHSGAILEKPVLPEGGDYAPALIPTEGYYEWQNAEDGKKTPHYLSSSEKDELLAFAGLYEFWPDRSLAEHDPGKWLLSCTVLTATAHDSLGHVI
jgi:putative SOS response-associated peptidase YedK